MKNNIKFEYLNHTLDEELIKKSKLVKTNDFIIGAVTSRGTNPKRCKNQNHSLVVTNKNLVMMALTDGRDDLDNSDLVAQILIEKLGMWFKRLPRTYINTPIVLESMLFGELRRVNSDFYKYYRPGASSFVLAIIGKKETFIANVGNCRGYVIKDGNISLETTDNLVWYNHNDKSLITPDEVKFLIGRDYVSRTIGGYPNSKGYFEPFISIIPNDYDSLLLTTHGITDVLDSSELNYYLDDEDLNNSLNNIIDKAIYSNPKELPKYLLEKFQELDKEKMLTEKTIPGDSNASAIVYKKTK